jgi:hypothetical protein
MNTDTNNYDTNFEGLEQMNHDMLVLINILWFVCGIAGGIILTVLAIYVYYYCKLLKKNKVSNLDDKPLLKKDKLDTATKKENSSSKYIQKLEIDHQDSVDCEEVV